MRQVLRAARRTFIGGGICSFGERCPRHSLLLGGILRIPTYNTIPDIGLSANKLANVSNVSKDVHTYIPTNGADLALKRLYFW